MFSGRHGAASPPHNLLALVKKFLCNNWFVSAFVHLTLIDEVSVVEGIREDALDAARTECLSSLADKTERVYLIFQIVQ
jgi:hypothetical protein